MTTPTTPTHEEAEAAVRAAEERLAALREEQRQVNARLAELDAERERLIRRSRELSRPGWKGYDGEIHAAVSNLEIHRGVLSDLDAPAIISGAGDRWIIVSAGPKQVKVRMAGNPHGRTDTLIRGVRPRQYNGFHTLDPADLEAAVAAFDAARKAKR